MRKTTDIMRRWQAKSASGEVLRFEGCKGGYFSVDSAYGLKVAGHMTQDVIPSPDAPVSPSCVSLGTQIRCGSKNIAHVPRAETKGYSKAMYEPGLYDWVSWYCALPLGTVVTVSCDIYAPDVLSSGGATGWRLVLKNGGGTVTLVGAFGASPGVRRVSYTHTKTLDFGTGDIYYSNFYFGNQSTSEVFRYAENFMIEVGDAVGIYEPYVPFCEAVLPCELYEGDIYYPMTGAVERHTAVLTLGSAEKDLTVDGVFRKFTESVQLACSLHYGVNGSIPYAVSGGKVYCGILPSLSAVTTNYPAFYEEHLVYLYQNMGVRLCFRYDELAAAGVLSADSANADIIAAANAYFDRKKADGVPIKVYYESSEPIYEAHMAQPIFAPRGAAFVYALGAGLMPHLSATVLEVK